MPEPAVGGLWEALPAGPVTRRGFAGLFAHRGRRHVSVRPDGRARRIDTLDALLPPGLAATRRYPGNRRRVLVRTGDPRPDRHHPRRSPEAGPAGPARRRDPLPRHVTGSGLFTIPHGPVRSGVSSRWSTWSRPRRGHTAPEHADLLQAPRHREALDGECAPMTACCSPSGPKGGLGRARDGVLPGDREDRGLRGPARRRPDQGAACQTGALAQPPRRHRPAGRRGRAGRGGRAVRPAQGTGGAAGQRGCAAAGSAAASWSPAAWPRAAETPAEILAGIGRLEQQVTADLRALMGTASFLDRLRGTGPLLRRGPASTARSARSARHPGPDDARHTRPYDGYPSWDWAVELWLDPDGDALARLQVRQDEMRFQSFHLLATGG